MGHQRARGAALREEPGDAEQRHPCRAKEKVRAVIVTLGMGYCRRGRSGRRDESGDIHLDRPVGHHNRREDRGNGDGAGRGFTALGDCDGRGGENHKHRERDRILATCQNKERCDQQIDR